MEVSGCILLFSHFFLHLLSTYINLPHLLSLNQSFSCFLQLVPSFSSLYVFHQLHVLLPSSNIFLRSSQNITIPPHHSPFGSLSAASFNPNMSISSTVFLLSTNFTLHIAVTIHLSVLKIPTSFSFKHHVSLPYNRADLT